LGETLEILRGLRATYEDFHHVRIDDDALANAVAMSRRLRGHQPDVALEVLDDACALVSNTASDSASGDEAVVRAADVTHVMRSAHSGRRSRRGRLRAWRRG
jgi:ATP-dependent Clp protease ATP-binding subunit ClpA